MKSVLFVGILVGFFVVFAVELDEIHAQSQFGERVVLTTSSSTSTDYEYHDDGDTIKKATDYNPNGDVGAVQFTI